MTIQQRENFAIVPTISVMCMAFVSAYDPEPTIEVRHTHVKGEILFRGTRTEVMNHYMNTDWLLASMALRDGYIVMAAALPSEDI